jgi:hypothetical protein
MAQSRARPDQGEDDQPDAGEDEVDFTTHLRPLGSTPPGQGFFCVAHMDETWVTRFVVGQVGDTCGPKWWRPRIAAERRLG